MFGSESSAETQALVGAFLGHGIGLRRQHFAHLLQAEPRGVDWFEIISEDYFSEGGRHWRVLERVRQRMPVVMHGVGLGIGNSDPICVAYLKQLMCLARRIEPAWISDHLCWGNVDDAHSHELLPMPYDDESLAHVAARVALVQDVLRRPILLENVSAYAAFADNDYAECDFLNELTRTTGCRLLLDVNNVAVCAHNLGFDAQRYVDRIDADSVAQLHLAGHSDYGDHWMDTHVGPVPDNVWSLYRRVIARTGPVSTLVEWDSEVPAFEVVAAEASRARALLSEVCHG